MKEQEHIEEMTMYELKLYVVGRTPKSVDVIEELVRLLEKGDGIEEGVRSARAVWNCENNEGQKVARGIYICLITTSGGETKTGKIAFIK